ncbi:MAG: CO dehydrogenase/CO-methylating acetyl-CoA synthase complex subunit beta [Candidatus Heimdallarchaeota archaeon]|nr:CO dehydrogenase/CO-methylating acetyl-CoA synthase complex subunit beta [Candidatus Heimdallarchaeota archaeon]
MSKITNQNEKIDPLSQETIQSGLTKLLSNTREQIARLLENSEIGYPETGYFLPTIYGFFGKKITSEKGIQEIFDEIIKIKDQKKDSSNQGLIALVLIELYEAINYYLAEGNNPYCSPYSGFIPDTIFRKLGVPLVDGSICGIAIIYGKGTNNEETKKLVRNFQKKGILVLLVGEVVNQLLETKFEMGLEHLVVPIGDTIYSLTHVINLLTRVAMAFGGNPPGNQEKLLQYLEEKIPGFVLTLGEFDDLSQLIVTGIITTGLPVINDQGVEIPSKIYAEQDYSKLVDTCITLGGIKPNVQEIDLPIDYSFAFEGQTVRKADTFVEFGGGRSVAFELLKTVDTREIEDKKIIIQGRSLDQLEPGVALPLALLVEVSGKGMEKDFEPVLERQIHHFFNYGDGLWHNAQRDIVWIRISNNAVAQGFQLRHLGEIIYHRFHQEFSNIVSKIQVKIITNESLVQQLLPEAKQIYQLRDARLQDLTDETVDTFYSCLLCQSFAPNHVCIITPERTGLCGAVNWLDAKTSFEINPTGGNQPISVNKPMNSILGSWKEVNNYVYKESHHATTKVCLYSIMQNPTTSCGCFECIAAVIPEANGIMIVNREYPGTTPLGLPFSTLAGSVGGGVQTPGFMGIGKNYIVSKKFLVAEGGINRIVWMPRELKQFLRQKIEELTPNFFEKIADEQSAETLEELLTFLSQVKHPALEMESIF